MKIEDNWSYTLEVSNQGPSRQKSNGFVLHVYTCIHHGRNFCYTRRTKPWDFWRDGLCNGVKICSWNEMEAVIHVDNVGKILDTITFSLNLLKGEDE